jgi:flagellar basal-body rod modification protein FlgD
MKMQDPTKPMDSQALMDSQLKMSQIEANNDMATSLTALTKSYAASSLSNAVGFMGKTIEDGSTDKTTGILNSYVVGTIESNDGDVFVNARKQTGYYHSIRTSEEVDGETVYTNLTYDVNGKIFDKDGNDTGVNLVILDNGSFKIENGKYVCNDNDGKQITDEDILSKYQISSPLAKYSDEFTKILVNNITKVYG